MKRLDRILTIIENTIAAGALGLAALISITNVIARQFGESFFWSEEAVVYLIILSTFIGAVVTLRHNEHVNVGILSAFFRERGKKWVALVGGVVTIAYFLIMAILGWLLLAEPFSRTTITPVLKLPLWVVELAVPVGMTLMLLRSLEMVWRSWKYGPEAADPEDVAAAEAEAAGVSAADISAVQKAPQR